MSGKQISLMLFVFGAAGLFGNILSGILLNKRAMQTALVYPIIFGLLYLLIFILGDYSIPMTILIAIWGTLYTLGLNICQNSITTAAYEAPTFANGLFIAFGNLGISLGTFVGAEFISGFGIRSILWAGLLFMIISLAFIAVRALRYTPKKINASGVFSQRLLVVLNTLSDFESFSSQISAVGRPASFHSFKCKLFVRIN